MSKSLTLSLTFISPPLSTRSLRISNLPIIAANMIAVRPSYKTAHTKYHKTIKKNENIIIKTIINKRFNLVDKYLIL